jgi:hypothetical protein
MRWLTDSGGVALVDVREAGPIWLCQCSVRVDPPFFLVEVPMTRRKAMRCPARLLLEWSIGKACHLTEVATEALAEPVARSRYTRRINFREKWRGYLWQGRFASFVMDEPYLLAASRYVELNPVRAGLVPDPADWPWSSARSHLSGRDDRLVRVAPMLAMIADWRGLLNNAIREEDLRDLREHVRTGCPLGNATFVDRLERAVGRILRPRKSGRPSKLLKRP